MFNNREEKEGKKERRFSFKGIFNFSLPKCRLLFSHLPDVQTFFSYSATFSSKVRNALVSQSGFVCVVCFVFEYTSRNNFINLALQATDSSVSQRNFTNHLLITVTLTAITAIQIILYFVANIQCA